jgi:hypothetical protein
MSSDSLSRMTLLGALLALAIAATACDAPMSSPSTLERPQILAVQFTPRVLQLGSSQGVLVLGHDLSTTPITLEGCMLPWIPEESGIRCAAEDVPSLPEHLRGALPLGSGTEESPQEVTFLLPAIPLPTCTTDADCYGLGGCADGTCPLRLWIRVDDEPDGGALNAVAQIATGDLIDNPAVTALSTEVLEAPLPTTLEIGQEVIVVPTLTDPYGEGGQVLSYFTTGGSFNPWHTNEGTPSTFTAPIEAGEVTLTVIVRDPGGGVGWAQHTLTVTEAP